MKTLLAQKPANPPSDIDRPRTGLEQFRHNAGIRTPPYGKRVEKFMIDAEAAIRHNAGLKSKMIRVELEVINEGSTPARDVLATMHFPNGLKPLSRKQANEMFHRVPEAPWDRGDGRLLPAGLMPSYSLAGLHPVPDATRLSIRETNSYEVDWHVLKLRQEHRSKIDPFLILFENELFSFEIEYSIVADNAPDVVNGKLNVVVERA